MRLLQLDFADIGAFGQPLRAQQLHRGEQAIGIEQVAVHKSELVLQDLGVVVQVRQLGNDLLAAFEIWQRGEAVELSTSEVVSGVARALSELR